MIRLFAVVSFLAAIGSAAEVSKVVHSARPFSPDTPLPIMDHGWLIFLDFDGPAMYVQRPNGTPAYTVSVQVPGGVRADVNDAAVDAHGRVAVAVAYPGGETGVEGAIVFVDSSGKQDQVYPLGRYLPSHLCFDSEGNVWTKGWQRDLVKRDMEDENDYAVVRRFNRSMEQTGAFVNRSSFPRPALSPANTAHSRWGIRASRDRIGALLRSGETMVWIELDRGGKELGRWTLDREHSRGLAFAGGELYTAVARQLSESTWVSNLVRFDRANGGWQALAASEDPVVVMDADGDQVVVAKDHGRTYEWLKP